jgi:hypothetical protein
LDAACWALEVVEEKPSRDVMKAEVSNAEFFM